MKYFFSQGALIYLNKNPHRHSPLFSLFHHASQFDSILWFPWCLLVSSWRAGHIVGTQLTSVAWRNGARNRESESEAPFQTCCMPLSSFWPSLGPSVSRGGRFVASEGPAFLMILEPSLYQEDTPLFPGATEAEASWRLGRGRGRQGPEALIS